MSLLRPAKRDEAIYYLTILYMRLGLKEVAVAAALATTGCTSPDLEDAKQEVHPVSAVSDVHGDVITEETVKAVRTACATANVQEQNNFMGEFSFKAHWKVTVGYLELAGSAGKQAEKECLALHGLTLEEDITDTMPTDQSFKSDIKADDRRRGESTLKIDGVEFGGGGFISII